MQRAQTGSMVRRRQAAPAAGGVPAPPAQKPAQALALALQRAAGNRATARVLARKPGPKAPSTPKTGMRADAAIERYTRKAVWFWREHADRPLVYYAKYLGAAAGTELDAVGCPSPKFDVRPGQLPGAAEFDAEFWTVSIDPGHIGVDPESGKIGELSANKAAELAMTVYHESRHAEQRFRMARVLAGKLRGRGDKGSEIAEALRMDADAAAAAAGKPLRAANARRGELAEAVEWRRNTAGGEDATYREAVTHLSGEARLAAKLAHEAKPEEVEDVKDRVTRLVRAWGRHEGAVDYIRSHSAKVKKRETSAGRTVILGDITAIDAAYTRVTSALEQLEAAWAKADAKSRRALLKPLAEALKGLSKAVYGAYTNQPVERDAWDAGLAVYEQFLGIVESGRRVVPGGRAAAAARR